MLQKFLLSLVDGFISAVTLIIHTDVHKAGDVIANSERELIVNDTTFESNSK